AHSGRKWRSIGLDVPRGSILRSVDCCPRIARVARLPARFPGPTFGVKVAIKALESHPWGRKMIPVVAVVATGLVLATIFWPRHRRPPNRLLLSGNIEAHESVLAFKVPGRIVGLPVNEGQQVQAGEVLAKLDDDDYRQQVALDEATLHTREAELALALAG